MGALFNITMSAARENDFTLKQLIFFSLPHGRLVEQPLTVPKHLSMAKLARYEIWGMYTNTGFWVYQEDVISFGVKCF